MATNEMKVLKRDGKLEDISFDKILNRVKKLGEKAEVKVNFSQLCLKVIDQLYDKIPTKQIDELTAEQCASMVTTHPNYDTLAGYVVVSNHQKNTHDSFFKTMEELYNYHDIHGVHSPLIAESLWNVVRTKKDIIEKEIDYNRDFLIDFFGFKTLERAYLMKVNKVVRERPQDMWMRVSIGIHGNDLEKAFETYHLMSRLVFTHATPTLFNAGTPRPQLSSCYLLAMEDDSIDGIFSTLHDCAKISKWAGGIGLHIHNVRSSGSHIKGTNGTSNGIVPMLRVFNACARYVDQGGGKRPGSFAIYMEPHHPDIEVFLEMRKNHGDEELKARDLFYALWISDHFMKCVKNDDKWYLFDPSECPGLSDVVGTEYEHLYNEYVMRKSWSKCMKARELWFKILDSQMETGTPYILYKDACNLKSNQQNLGVIKSSNLCTEIIEYSSPKETAVCNLASIALSKCVNEETKEFDYDFLHRVAKIATNNLDKIIDVNFYRTDKTLRSNKLHRPVGIGVQGFADALFKMNVAFHSDQAKDINKNIFETIYHASLEMSNEIARNRKKGMLSLKQMFISRSLNFVYPNHPHSEHVMTNFPVNDNKHHATHNNMLLSYKPVVKEISHLPNYWIGAYSSFEGSPVSRGVLQFDMWGVEPSNRYDWKTLKANIRDHGIRNSLLVAPMPTASTSQILGNNEAFEPITSNVYSRRVLAGDYLRINKYLQMDLINLGLWNEDIKNNIIANRGSVQHIEGLSDELKQKYKIVWEMPMKHLIDMAADRGAFIDQSQSLNLWLEDPDYNTLTSMHFYSWEKGLKTGIYYLRRKPKHQPQQFTIDPSTTSANASASYENNEPCEMCSA